MCLRTVVAALGFLSLASCSIVDPGDCVAIGYYGLEVTVVDSIDGTVPLVPVTLAVSGDLFVETHHREGNGTLQSLTFLALFERSGIYEVAVSAPGYVPWTRTNVAITRRGHCDVIQTVRLNARLRRS
jgi:hypothetical protein